MDFPLLFSLIKIGPVTLPNRIVVPGHYPAMRDPDTLPGDRLGTCWESRARGRVGPICTGVWGVHPSTLMAPSRMPQAREKLKHAADTIKRHGTRFFVQLWHGVSLTPHRRLVSIGGSPAHLANTLTDKPHDITGLDTVVVSFGGVKDNELYYALKQAGWQVHAAGDCRGGRKILWAVNDGATVGRAI